MRCFAPTLPRDGTDLVVTGSRDGHVDPTLPRDGTDLVETAALVARRRKLHQYLQAQSVRNRTARTSKLVFFVSLWFVSPFRSSQFAIKIPFAILLLSPPHTNRT